MDTPYLQTPILRVVLSNKNRGSFLLRGLIWFDKYKCCMGLRMRFDFLGAEGWAADFL